jgi:hypothetical protein
MTLPAGLADVALLETLLLVFTFAAGLVAGSLGLLMFGHLLSEDWLRPVRAPLEATARLILLVALLAVPVLLSLDRLYPWALAGEGSTGLDEPRAAWLAPGFFQARAALILGLWLVLTFLVARPGHHRRLSAFGLALLVPSAALAAQDWVMSRDPYWLGTLQGLALFVEQLAVALAAAVLAVLLRRGLPARSHARGLERAVLTLAVATMWLWFIQFVVVWAADLPAEAAWYLRRMDGWAWLKLGVLVPALSAAIVLTAPPGSGALRLGAACALLLVQHAGHLLWLLRPEAPLAAPPLWLDAVALALLLALWAVWTRLTSRLAAA